MQRMLGQKNWDNRQRPEGDGADAKREHLRPVVRGPSVGDELRHAREAAGISVEDAAASLRIQMTHLKALEDSDHDALPGATYAIGFLRSYADYLGLDAKHVVARFKEEAEIRARPTPLIFPQPIGAAQRPSGRLVLLSILVAACAYGAWLIYNNFDHGLIDEVPPPPERLSALIKTDQAARPDPAVPSTPDSDAAATDDADTAVETPPADSDPAANGSEPAATGDGVNRTETSTETAPAVAEAAPAVPGAVTREAATSGIGAAPSEPQQPATMTARAAPAPVPAPEPEQPRAAEAPPTAAFAHVEPTRVEVAPREEPAPAAPAGENNGNGEQVAAADASGVPGGRDSDDAPTGAASALPSDQAKPGSAAMPANDAVTDTAPTVTPASDGAADSAAAGRAVAEALNDAAPTPADTAAPQSVATGATSPPPPPAVNPLTSAAATANGAVPGYRPQVYGAANGDARVVIRARADSWVQIQGADSELLLTRILRAGDTYRAPNRSDLLLMAGNAGAIELIVDGESLGALGPEGEVRRNVPLAIDTIRQQVYGLRRGQP